MHQSLEKTLQLARPTWGRSEVAKVKTKLGKIGIDTTPQFAEILSRDDGQYLNALLKNVGERAFSAETRLDLTAYMATLADVRPQAKASASQQSRGSQQNRAAHREAGTDASARSLFVANADPSPQEAQPVEDAIPDLDALLMQLDEEELQDQMTHEQLEASAREKGLHLRAQQLEDPKDFQNLLDRIDRLESMTATKLQYEIEQRGYAVFDGQSRKELIEKVKDVLIIEALEPRSLQEACRVRGYDVAIDQPKDEILQLLAYGSWETLGLPVSRLPNISVARELLGRVLELKYCGHRELVERCRRRNVPTEGLESDTLRAQLKQVFIWEKLPVDELRKECDAHGIIVDVGLGQSGDAAHIALFNELVMSIDNIAIEGTASRLDGADQAISEKVCRLQALGLLSLQSELRRQRLPFDATADRQALADRLREVLVWREMPQRELRTQCVQNGLDADGSTDKMIRRLLQRRDSLLKWDARGIPMRRLAGSEHGPRVMMECEALEQLSTEDLLVRYREIGFPEEETMDRTEVVRCLQMLTAWQAMKLGMLREECRAHGLSMDSVRDSDTEEDQTFELIDLLLKEERMAAWEQRGFQARRIGEFGKVLSVVSTYRTYKDMSASELKEVYVKAGLPIGDGRHDLLEVLKHVMIWEMLPMREFTKDCAAEAIVMDDASDEVEQRDILIRAMVVHKLKRYYLSKDIPVERLGASVVQVANLHHKFESLNAQQLQDTCKDFGIPVTPGVQKQELMRYARDVVVWAWLPISELWKECENFGWPMAGFDMKTPEDDLKEQLTVRLMLRWRETAKASKNDDPRLPEPSGVEEEADGKGLAPWKMKEVWRYIELMRDPIMIERLCSVPCKPLPRDIYLPVGAKTWKPLEAALVVLSAGAFDPEKEREQDRRPEATEDGRVLISVTCPTSERRQNFHPLLYESFCRQSYEPKELVVVETGKTPSRFFMEKARVDTRIVYRHYSVDDSKVGEQEMERNHDVAWSLGLKRNIACHIARGDVIAQFDDDDLYAPNYLAWMWSQLEAIASPKSAQTGQKLSPAATKLIEWHLLDIATLRFGYLDVESDRSVPLQDRRGWLYGWGFSYMFTRSAWELYPFPDVEFAEDAGFYEGFMARGIPVTLARCPETRVSGLVAHSHHAKSTSGGSGVFENGKGASCNSILVPKAFQSLMSMVKQVHHGWSASGLKPGFLKPGGAPQVKWGIGGMPVLGKSPPTSSGKGQPVGLKMPMGLKGGGPPMGLKTPAGLKKGFLSPGTN